MESRYDEQAAANLVRTLAPDTSEALALRTYTARLVGSEASLVLHGGGNTSVKATATTLLGETVDVLHVKGSGWDLATIEPPGHPAVRLAPLRKLRALDAMTDEAMVNELRTNLLDASAPNPSVETLLHALLPARFIDHTHADAILMLADQPDGARLCASIFGRGLVWVPYVMPGFALARRCAELFERVAAEGEPALMVLERHGLFTWGATARESYERTLEAVTRAERYVVEHGRSVSHGVAPQAAPAATEVLPRLRGAVARLAENPVERGPIVRMRTSPAILAFLQRPDAAALVAKGCATPDHVIRTKPSALLVAQPPYGDGKALSARFDEAITGYAAEYDAYFGAMCRAKGVQKKKLDPWPRVVLLPGFGACALGSTASEADIALDLYEHTIDVMTGAAAIGAYEPVGRADLFDMEYWSLEQAKLKPVTPQPLSRCVALVTGAASGIGLATATRFAAAGAHVALLDRDAGALEKAVAAVAQTTGPSGKRRLLAIAADVLDAAAVERAVARTVAEWGGLDVVVSNAGAAPEGRLDTAAGQTALRDSLELNCLSHATVARLSTAVMAAQGRGGCLLFNASKSAFNPGAGFGPYAVAKTALVALMRQYAVDLGGAGIRSNAVNADRIRTHLFADGVLESRAKARGLAPDDYFKANLLGREVTGGDVADAFLYLATARATTGCVVTVDGGNAAAFPR
ncbi:MAG TPA: bifunctional aldolase/short-chain dehydrogenase [Polyangiaceae bacterium]|jgi:rhamnose utilization protein RhaD (predicted bifunctional aldolase and dehydrogenase)/NAD(P)-dependent dehydrogenase (short-subunit alcohol dehydrogenase family)|nr:bifunctional aldolase/short-chain dehydrogenase [Polyangiaceae bacterium]